MSAYLKFISLALIFISCKTTEVIKQDSLIYRYEKIYDTIILPPDSTWIKAYLECDSMGNVLLNKLESEMPTKFVIENNTATIRPVIQHEPIVIPGRIKEMKKTSLNYEKKEEKIFGLSIFWIGVIIGGVGIILVSKAIKSLLP